LEVDKKLELTFNMKKTELNNLIKLVTKVGSYTPKEVPNKPSKAPTSKQLKEVYSLDKKNMTIEVGK
jgi:hypothetical protein